jgi:hypothetical protein
MKKIRKQLRYKHMARKGGGNFPTYILAVAPRNRTAFRQALILPLRINRNSTCLAANGEGIRPRSQQANR